MYCKTRLPTAYGLDVGIIPQCEINGVLSHCRHCGACYEVRTYTTETETVTNEHWKSYWIECGECGMRTGEHNTKEEALEVWERWDGAGINWNDLTACGMPDETEFTETPGTEYYYHGVYFVAVRYNKGSRCYTYPILCYVKNERFHRLDTNEPLPAEHELVFAWARVPIVRHYNQTGLPVESKPQTEKQVYECSPDLKRGQFPDLNEL